ncbi:MAG: glycosyltransferase [Candidatus Peribacteraceae bacterium]|nr:glycosyltransferase [Candidatus Peribacteraceae bacterium]
MKLALIADWLTTFGGAEHVIAAFHELWPTSPVLTTVADPRRLGPLSDADIRTCPFLQTVFRLTHRHQLLLPLMPRYIERMDLSGYDVILSSSHAVAKGVIVPPGSVHICYCHTPMRYAWEMEEDYLRDFRLRGPLRKRVKSELKTLRRWDLSNAKRVDRFIANSTETQRRIQRIYGRKSVVIPPPVDAKFFNQHLPATNHPTTPRLRGAGQQPATPYFLALGRLVPYKRFDLLVELANRRRFRLILAGSGSDERRLRSLAGPTVTFLGRVPDEALPQLYAGAEALLFPQVEDAGIVPMEAQACGTPVIAYAKGGVLDVIDPGKTGLLVPEQTVDAFAQALGEFRIERFDRSSIRESARRFHVERFKERISAEVEDAVQRRGSCMK